VQGGLLIELFEGLVESHEGDFDAVSGELTFFLRGGFESAEAVEDEGV
jgi:hypothetical protein